MIVNRASNIGHHARIGDFASIGPGVTISGFIEIGSDVLIGAGVVIAPRIGIGDGSIVAPGSVVMFDVPARITAMGAPLRFVPHKGGDR